MKYILLILLLMGTFHSQAKKIKLSKSDNYYKALQSQSIDITKRDLSIKKKVNNLYPLPPFNKPNLNGNFSQQLAYKNSKRSIKLTSDGQSIQN